ncbi:MAG TPA: RidA family protein [Bacteroidales bacterium]|nr:RidA family protein [Bacteroidales bacterium]HPS27471.1 RidA family protein [Bacteroidales bacterium]
MKKVINTNQAPAAIGPYSQAILANGMLFVSGQLPVDPATGLMAQNDIEVNTKQVMDNISAILKEAGIDFTNVIKTTIFLADMNDFGKVNEIYASYFTSEPPARETVQVARLPKDARIEISVIAAL